MGCSDEDLLLLLSCREIGMKCMSLFCLKCKDIGIKSWGAKSMGLFTCYIGIKRGIFFLHIYHFLNRFSRPEIF